MSTEVKQEGEFKIKKRTPKKLVNQNEKIAKLDLTKPGNEQGVVIPSVQKVVIPKEEFKKQENAIQEPSAEESVLRTEQPEVGLQEVGQVQEEPVVASENVAEEVDSPLQQIDENVQVEQNLSVQPEPSIVNTKPEVQELPEGVDKLIKFMQETGGDVNDYARLNADYSDVDNSTLIKEYYKKTKPHLDSEDLNLLLEDFDYDEELEEDRDIRKKKLAFKEEVAKAKNFLEYTNSKYY